MSSLMHRFTGHPSQVPVGHLWKDEIGFTSMMFIILGPTVTALTVTFQLKKMKGHRNNWNCEISLIMLNDEDANLKVILQVIQTRIVLY